MVRLRYKQEGKQLICKNILGPVDIYTVVIDLDRMSYVIENQRQVGKASGVHRDRAKLLKRVKSDLKELGVVFSDEVRRRKRRMKEGGSYDSDGNDVFDKLLVLGVRGGPQDGFGGGDPGEQA